jgi:tripartite-type tricarboxylate transporter receptor subunit TctC
MLHWTRRQGQEHPCDNYSENAQGAVWSIAWCPWLPHPDWRNRPHKEEEMNNLMRWTLVLAAALLAVPAGAQRFPDRPVKFIVAYPPAGSIDLTARLLAKFAEPRLGQSVVVENKPGGNGLIGAGFVQRAEPDGYTLYVGTMAGLTNVMTKASTIDPLHDFIPVANGITGGFFMFVRSGFPAHTLGELVAYGKANPGKINFASSSPNSEIIFQALKAQTGLDAASIAYKGSAPTVQALLAGDCDISIDSIPAYVSHVQSGKLLPVFSTSPSSQFPSVPNIDKLGVKDFDATFNIGVFAPLRTPAATVSTLNSALRDAVSQPEFVEQAHKFGGEPSKPSPDEFRRMIELELNFWRDAARIAKWEPQ